MVIGDGDAGLTPVSAADRSFRIDALSSSARVTAADPRPEAARESDELDDGRFELETTVAAFDSTDCIPCGIAMPPGALEPFPGVASEEVPATPVVPAGWLIVAAAPFRDD